MLTATEIIKKIPDVQADEQQFLGLMFATFPDVHAGFEKFVITPPSARVRLAAEVLEKKPRSGWKRLAIDEDEEPRDILSTHAGEYYGSRFLLFEKTAASLETVLEHSAEASELAMLIYPNDPNLQMLIEILKFHDFPESIMTDFTPEDPISRADKERLELIALRVLTQSKKDGDLLSQHIFNCINIFEGEVRDFAPIQTEMLEKIAYLRQNNQIKPQQIQFVNFIHKLYSQNIEDLGELQARAKDTDLIHLSVRGTRIINDQHSQLSEPEARSKMQEFWNYVLANIRSREARRFVAALNEAYRTSRDLPYKKALLESLQILEFQKTRDGW